jgi:hypothetical protein
MNPKQWTLALPAVAGFFIAATASAQTADPSASDAASAANADEVVVLNPFQVTTEKDRGYRATNSISGTRLDTAIKELPMPIEVITEEFLRDTGSTCRSILLPPKEGCGRAARIDILRAGCPTRRESHPDYHTGIFARRLPPFQL